MLFRSEVSPLVVRDGPITLAPIDVGALPPVDAGASFGVFDTLKREYQQGEQVINKVGEWFGQRAQRTEQSVDQLRRDITDWGDRQNWAVDAVAHQLANNVGFYEGAAIGAYKMAAGTVSLVNGAEHLLSPIGWAMDPQGNLQRAKGVFGAAAKLETIGLAAQVNPAAAWPLVQPAFDAATADYRNYWSQGEYAKALGLGTFNAGTMLLGGIGGVAKLGEVGEAASALERVEPLVEGVPDAAGDVAESAIVRPTWRQSEIDVGNDLGSGYSDQVSYLNGEQVPTGTLGSVRPDWVADDGSMSIEVKNYNLSTNQNGLINNVSQQALQRAENLPAGMEQQIVIDTRGQVITPDQENAIIQGIVQKSNGVIDPTSILFKK